MLVYKKVNLKRDGNCYPLFIDNKNAFTFGEWMHCKYVPTKGFAPRSVQTADGTVIGGWHCCYTPVAPHLADETKDGKVRVWIECESRGRSTRYNRPESQGGAWLLVEEIKPLRILTADEVEKIVRNAQKGDEKSA